MINLIAPYCERLAFGAEQLNVASNLVFLIAGYQCWQLLKRKKAQHNACNPLQQTSNNHNLNATLHLLPALLVCIGLGSAIFHANPTRLTHLLDIGPIALFAGLALVNALHAHAKLRTGLLISMSVLWLATSAASAFFTHILAGSLFYAPTLLALLLLSLIRGRNQKWYLLASALFSAALLFRSLDLWACHLSPVGSHFLWHTLAASAAYVIFAALLKGQTIKPLAKS